MPPAPPASGEIRPDFPRRGFYFGMAAAFCLSSQDAAIKLLSGDYHIMQIVFVRAAIGLLLVMPFLVRGGGGLLRPQKPRLAAARVLFTLAANLCYYIALSRLELTVYTSIGLMVFIFVTALSGPVLKEKSAFTDWLAVGAGLAGVWIVVNPSANAPIDIWAAALLLFGALMWAFSITATRALGATMSAPAILFYSNAALSALTLAFLPAVWRAPEPRDWALLLLLGVFGACGQGLAIAAYRAARMRAVIPTQHTMLLWAALFAWILWDTPPDARLCIGGAIIVAASLSALPRPGRTKRRKK